MRKTLSSQPAARNPVVATYRSRAEADDSLAALMRAGFGPEMLELVGHRTGEGEAYHAATVPARQAGSAASGWLLGASWSAFVCAATLGPVTMDLRLLAMAATGTLALILQAQAVARTLRPPVDRRRQAASGALRPALLAGPASPWRFLLIVHGPRSEVALARDILAH